MEGDQEGRGHQKKATTRFKESIQADIEQMECEAVNKCSCKLRCVGPQSRPCAPPDALSNNKDQTYGETSDGTDEKDDDELEATIENSEAHFVTCRLTSY